MDKTTYITDRTSIELGAYPETLAECFERLVKDVGQLATITLDEHRIQARQAERELAAGSQLLIGEVIAAYVEAEWAAAEIESSAQVDRLLATGAEGPGYTAALDRIVGRERRRQDAVTKKAYGRTYRQFTEG